ncbi:MAG: MoaD/ThiS family protein [Candidatus Hodarchaeales archaeon]|jgi:molybdopterin converting factor small subunit
MIEEKLFIQILTLRETMNNTILVKFHGRLGHIAGETSINLKIKSELTIKSILIAIKEKIPSLTPLLYDNTDLTQLNSRVIILVNGHSIKLLKGLKTKLKSNDSIQIDRIDFLSPVGGG